MSDDLQRLITRTAALAQARLRDVASRHGLKLVQLQALVFVSRANRYSDSPASVADYLSLTRGTVSQTLKALEGRGLIVKHPDPSDRRSVRCRITEVAAPIVAEVESAQWLRTLPSEATDEATEALRRVLAALQRARDHRTFDVCETCRFHERGPDGARCGLTSEPLTPVDATLLCREHEPGVEPHLASTA